MDWPLAHSVASETGQPVHVVCAVLATLGDAAGCSHVALDRLLCLSEGTVGAVVAVLEQMGRFADGGVVAGQAKRSTSTERVRRHRAKRQEVTHDETPCNVSCNVTETVSCNAALPLCTPPLKDIRVNTPPSPSERPPVGAVSHEQPSPILTAQPAEAPAKPKRAATSSQRFTPPTVDEVASYCRERGNAVDAEQWHAHYTANGWRVGKNPMKDWQAAVRTWERSATGRGAHGPGTRDGPPMPRTYRECQDAERRQTAEEWLGRRGLVGNGKQEGDLGCAPGDATPLRVIDADFRA